MSQINAWLFCLQSKSFCKLKWKSCDICACERFQHHREKRQLLHGAPQLQPQLSVVQTPLEQLVRIWSEMKTWNPTGLTLPLVIMCVALQRDGSVCPWRLQVSVRAVTRSHSLRRRPAEPLETDTDTRRRITTYRRLGALNAYARRQS